MYSWQNMLQIWVVCSDTALQDCYQILCGNINGSYTFDMKRIK